MSDASPANLISETRVSSGIEEDKLADIIRIKLNGASSDPFKTNPQKKVLISISLTPRNLALEREEEDTTHACCVALTKVSGQGRWLDFDYPQNYVLVCFAGRNPWVNFSRRSVVISIESHLTCPTLLAHGVAAVNQPAAKLRPAAARFIASFSALRSAINFVKLTSPCLIGAAKTDLN
ncbi:hypothetical protein RRG08_019687 [Elysia crispata]|uniref:Uncharacterized protein n=1 Tax=Elysia crispata TaxID=231223 RepID=A0AAE0XS04_9GAST|nr:hypothetical protein RRG08_019687 [Elysia crispata]